MDNGYEIWKQILTFLSIICELWMFKYLLHPCSSLKWRYYTNREQNMLWQTIFSYQFQFIKLLSEPLRFQGASIHINIMFDWNGRVEWYFGMKIKGQIYHCNWVTVIKYWLHPRSVYQIPIIQHCMSPLCSLFHSASDRNKANMR